VLKRDISQQQLDVGVERLYVRCLGKRLVRVKAVGSREEKGV
jgi:hypothetical protein